MESAEYTFTKDWFHWAPDIWKQLVPLLPERKRFLELGVFEGRATVWMMEHMLEDGGIIVCVDTWAGGEDHTAADMVNAEANFLCNVRAAQRIHKDRRVVINKDTTTNALALLLERDAKLFDFIYIDASHVAKDVLTDACMAWPLLKPGGIMVFDDYLWGQIDRILHRPKVAVDAFVNIFSEELEIVSIGYQLIVRKK